MTDHPRILPGSLPDEVARLLIVERLHENLLVEAGAGSGKTTALVDRMVALIRRRVCKVGEIAAVTFTRKAAADLRQRFQVELERALAILPPEDPAADAVEEAVRDIDDAFLGTIHAFCAKLLRERPLEAGLDPGFREVLESEAYRLQRRFWVQFLERLATDGDPDLGELGAPGDRSPTPWKAIFARLVENPDVDFGWDSVPPPDPEATEAVRRRFEGLLDRSLDLMPEKEPERGWDSLAREDPDLGVFPTVAGLGVRRQRCSRPSPRFGTSAPSWSQKRWSDSGPGKAAAKALQEEYHEFGAGEVATLVEQWWAHRYPVVVRLARRAADMFAEERRRTGQLNFQDLLVLTAALLRSDPVARRDLGGKYRRLLVDEFQDTDPLQAEIILLLASNPGSSSAGSEELDLEAGVEEDWRDRDPPPWIPLRRGGPEAEHLPVSTSRHRALRVREEPFRGPLAARSVSRRTSALLSKIGDLVEGVFRGDHAFPGSGSDRQAAFAPLLTQRSGSEGILATYTVEGRNQAEIALDDAERIASCIARRVGDEGDRDPGDFMVLTRARKFLSVYARALEDRGLPVDVSGAGVGFEEELRGLLPPPPHTGRPGKPGPCPRLPGRSLLRRDPGPPRVLRYREAGGRLSILQAAGG